MKRPLLARLAPVVSRGMLCSCLAPAAACSSPSSPPDAGVVGGCPPYVSDADLTMPAVSFRSEILPIFQFSCARGGDSCHGDPGVVADHRPFLGIFDGDGGESVAQDVFSGLVGIKSTEDLTMNLVTAGDPAASFLMHKLDGDQCTLIAECMVPGSFRPNCGVFMPYQAPTLLPASLRDTVRRWMRQGAPND